MKDSRTVKSPITSLMLVDDNEFDQMMYKRLVDRSGLVEKLTQFVAPQEALDHLFEASNDMPSLVLLDINMPKIDGFEFLESVTSELGERMCPVIIMLTTSLDPRDEERARQHKVVRDFHNKPMTGELLKHLASMEFG